MFSSGAGWKVPYVPIPPLLEQLIRTDRFTNGVPTHLYAAPREGHQWGELRHQLFKANTELEWFEKYANHRTYVWEKAPGS